MIEIEQIVSPSPEQMEFVIEGMRNPMNSWDNSDSQVYRLENYFDLGDADATLMHRLSEAGSEHRKYARQMPLMLRVTAPLYWWKEADQYKVGTTTNSCSTMHKIHTKEFALDDFSHDHLFDGIDRVEGDNEMEYYENSTTCLEYTIAVLNRYRSKFLLASEKLKRTDLTDAERKHTAAQMKHFWWQMIQLLPSSYNQTRNWFMSYETAINIIRQRKNHKLDEWRKLVELLEGLPYMEEIMRGVEA